MALEIEAKVKVDSHEPVRSILQQSGARAGSIVLESNHIFDRADGSLWAQGCGLRIRSCRALAGQAPPSTITYKGPRLPSDLKLRTEIEIAVDDAPRAAVLLQALGFVEVMHFEKRRESWEFNRCSVELDELPYLGCYVEIEGADEVQVRAAQEALGLSRLASIRESYIALLMEYCRPRGLPVSRITFGRTA